MHACNINKRLLYICQLLIGSCLNFTTCIHRSMVHESIIKPLPTIILCVVPILFTTEQHSVTIGSQCQFFFNSACAEDNWTTVLQHCGADLGWILLKLVTSNSGKFYNVIVSCINLYTQNMRGQNINPFAGLLSFHLFHVCFNHYVRPCPVISKWPINRSF